MEWGCLGGKEKKIKIRMIGKQICGCLEPWGPHRAGPGFWTPPEVVQIVETESKDNISATVY